MNASNVNSQFNLALDGGQITLSNISIKEVTSGHGFVEGATTTTSVYGGNAPVLPRAVDVAREGEAEQIGNGRAYFNSSNDDYIDCGADVYDFSSGDFTISAWVYHDHANGQHAGIIGVRDSTNTEVQLYISSADNKVYSWNGSSNVGSTTAIADEVWTHVAMVQSGSNKKFYINGVLDNTASQANGTARPATFKIGFTGNGNEQYEGNLSQIGVWAGELTQSQIQSVMESTSYATIPASVKSTLSAEETSLPFANSGSYAYTTFSATSTGFTASDSSGANDVVTARMWTGDNSGKLYKITFDLTINSGATPSLYWSPDVAGGNGSGQTAMSAGSNTIYKTNTGSTYDWLLFNTSGAADYEVSNFSVKEVTNDLVGYWGLDADNSANGATQDSTTGETTTSVYNRDFAGVAHGSDPTALSYIYAYGSPGEKVIDTERIKIVDSSNTGVYWNESGLTASKLYKVTIDATGDVHSDGVYSGTISFTLSDGTFTGYKTGITTTGAIYLRAGNNTIPGTTYYDNLKVEEVTSNTGVLL